ncbi:MAG: DUF4307 domain-containing protein [Actinobacteria bacterium]|jgi:Domain of unknown function (DUF4307)|nr:DUF4307 domain-containing protein [Actinomycetota bacterium]NDH80631.1 DUF4307 domain-containing protein [Actinomycetota bacterium]NDI07519.1 DUF4307 domain-containing protein [Actinomycetota bacterium]
MNSKGSSEFSYEDRYGIKPAKGWKLPATILAVIGITWVFWAGLFHAKPEFRITLISFSVLSDEQVSIRYAIQRNDPTMPATCTLQARDVDKNIVGEIEDEITPGRASFERTTSIPTRSAAATALVARCRVK